MFLGGCLRIRYPTAECGVYFTNLHWKSSAAHSWILRGAKPRKVGARSKVQEWPAKGQVFGTLAHGEILHLCSFFSVCQQHSGSQHYDSMTQKNLGSLRFWSARRGSDGCPFGCELSASCLQGAGGHCLWKWSLGPGRVGHFWGKHGAYMHATVCLNHVNSHSHGLAHGHIVYGIVWCVACTIHLVLGSFIYIYIACWYLVRKGANTQLKWSVMSHDVSHIHIQLHK